jgi:hypothetical protein
MHDRGRTASLQCLRARVQGCVVHACMGGLSASRFAVAAPGLMLASLLRGRAIFMEERTAPSSLSGPYDKRLI